MKCNAPIYILSDGDGVIKIGHSRDPVRRRKMLGREDCEIVHVTKAYHEVERVERAAHKILRPHRVRGEWFRVTPKEALEAVAQAELEVCGGVQEDNVVVLDNKPFPVRLNDEDLRMLDDVRRVEPDIPTRPEMIRRLIERAHAARKGRK